MVPDRVHKAIILDIYTLSGVVSEGFKMKIEQMGTPAAQAANAPNQPMSARERAIAMLTKDVTPQVNQNNISPEEMGAIKAPSSEFESAVKSAQSHSTEEVDSKAPKVEPKSAAEGEPLSSQYAILARKEKALRQREQQLKTREEAFKQSDQAAKAPQAPAPLDESKYISKDRLTNDPFSVLTELGLTYDQLTELALNGPKPKEIELSNQIKLLQEEMKLLKGETESNKKSFQDQQTQTYKQAVAQIRNEAKILVDRDPNFETIKETGSLNDVVELIEEKFKQDGILLTVEEAAQQVEDYLLEEALKLAKIKKIQQKLMLKAAEPLAEQDSQSKQSQSLKTLTNSVGSTRQLSARERATLAFEGKLKR